MRNVIPLPTTNRTKREDALERSVDDLVSVFQELRTVERMTGRAGLSARVRLAIMDIVSAADRLAGEML